MVLAMDADAADSPTDLPGRVWRDALRRTMREAKRDHLTDWAAALTYFAMLSLFPALLVLVAILGIFGSYPGTTNALLDIVRDIAPDSAVRAFRAPIDEVVRNKGGAGALLGIGILGTLWSASAYVGAFIRASNVIYEIAEGRRFWKLRPLQIGITIVLVVTAALVGVGIVVTGPLARSVGDVLGVGATAVSVWDVVKWPILLAVVTTVVAFLYWVSPNVEQPAFRWITPGGVLAVTVWLIASIVFSVYVRIMGSYTATYGALTGIIVALVWLWLSNLAILIGAELNAELEGVRERRGVAAQRRRSSP